MAAKIGRDGAPAAVEALAVRPVPARHFVVALPTPARGLARSLPIRAYDVLVRHARARGAAELMVPAEILLVASLPLLGTGKPDYVAATGLAKEKSAAEPKANASGVAA